LHKFNEISSTSEVLPGNEPRTECSCCSSCTRKQVTGSLNFKPIVAIVVIQKNVYVQTIEQQEGGASGPAPPQTATPSQRGPMTSAFGAFANKPFQDE
jgi:hypothetical protein